MEFSSDADYFNQHNQNPRFRILELRNRVTQNDVKTWSY